MRPTINKVIKKTNQDNDHLKKENKKLKMELEELRKEIKAIRKDTALLVKKTTPEKPVNADVSDMELEQHGVGQAATHPNIEDAQAVTHPNIEGAQAVTQNDNDGFQIVTHKRQKRQRNSDDEDEKAKETSQKPNKKGKVDPIINKDKKEEVPPVTVKVNDWNAFSTKLIEEKINYNKARNTKEGVRISPNTANDYRNLIKSCEMKKMEYYTYTLNEDKKKYFVIKGLHISANCQDVEKELKELGASDAEVTRLISRRTKLPTAVMQLKTNYEPIKDITRLRFMVIKIENKRKEKGPIQCYKCQQYGHTRRNCGLEARCVRCGQLHESNVCKLEKTTSRNATCANCRGNHPANYKGCEYAKNKRPVERKTEERKQEGNNKKKIEERSDYRTPIKSREENRLKEIEDRMDKMMAILEKLMETRQRNG